MNRLPFPSLCRHHFHLKSIDFSPFNKHHVPKSRTEPPIETGIQQGALKRAVPRENESLKVSKERTAPHCQDSGRLSRLNRQTFNQPLASA
jgi:hypothetical protein